MPIVDRLVSITAGTSLDVMEADQYQYIPFSQAKLDFAFKAQQPAGESGVITGLTVQVYSGSDLLQQPSAIIVEAGPTRAAGSGGPVDVSTALGMQFPYDFLLSDIGMQGERIGVTLVNSSSGAFNVRAVVRIMPV